jgi:hypothetical protein
VTATDATAGAATDKAVAPSGPPAFAPVHPLPTKEALTPGPAPTPRGSTPGAINPIVVERPAILAALERYRGAHRGRSIDALKGVYPTLAGERLQAKERSFKNRKACRDLDVLFGEPEISLTADGTVAHVSVLSTYVCVPVTGQARPQQPLPDVFQMKKDGDAWVITIMGAMVQ